MRTPAQRAEVRRVIFGTGANAPPRVSEHGEQAALIDWAARVGGRYPELRWLYAVPNGGARHVAVAKKLKAEGVKAGVPDLCLPVARGGFHGAYIEMKAVKGRATPEQDQWAAHLKSAGYAHCLAHGFDEAQRFLLSYLVGTST